MSPATVLDAGRLERLETDFDHAVVSWLDADGYPINAPAAFRVDAGADTVHLDALDVPEPPQAGTEVLVTFSHVRPQPGVGYDERRYVNVRGPLRVTDGGYALEATRTTGWDEAEVPFFEYCERNVPRGLGYLRRISEEQGADFKPRLSRFWTFFTATRMPFLTATLVPVMLGAVVARAHGFTGWWLVVLALVGASCIHLGLNVLNDVFDADSGADDANVTPTPFSGGSRVIQHGIVSQRAMWAAAAGFFVVGSGIGVGLAVTRGIEILWLGLAGVFLSIFYTAPPFKLVYRGLGDIAVAAGFGPIMLLGTYFVVAQRFTAEAILVSIPVAVLIMLVLYVNQIPDRHGDAAAGKRTVAVRLSQDAIVTGYALFAGGAFAVIVGGVAAGVLTAWTLLALAPAALIPRIHRGLRDHYDEPYELMGAMGLNIGLHALTGLVLILAYVVEIAV